MKEYVDKSEVVAEIERQRKIYMYDVDNRHSFGRMMECNDLLVFLDTLEVKEVDDEKCKEYDMALSIAKSWYKSSNSSAQERNVALMIMGDKVREEL